MQYLGEFLSPQNSISQDQDKLTKYFYFRPDKYDNPDADLENIFIIKSMDEFPQRLDKLAENPAYAIESIEVSKRVSDEEAGVKNVSYVVTATYDLLENITKRENSGGGGASEDSSTTIYVDEDGNKIVGQILPWKQRAQWSFQPIETVVPFKKAYGLDGEYQGEPIVDVLNSAGTTILAETVNYQLEITYQKNYKDPQIWEEILKPYTNEFDYDLEYDYRGSFPSGTLLILPPTYSCQWAEVDRLDKDGKPEKDNDGNIIKDIEKYYSYTVKMIYNPKGHDKELLNIGTMAKFGGPLPYEQIYQVTVTNENGTILDGYPKYTSASDALREHQMQSKAGNVVSVEAVSEPLPLTTTGGIDYAAMRDPLSSPYVTRSFIQYLRRDFSLLPFKN
jgi:hypothetical protein